MSEETTTQEITEEIATEVTTGEEPQVSEEEKSSIEEVSEVSTETTIDDIVSGKKPGEDKTPAWAKKRFDELTAKIYEKDRRIKELEAVKAVPAIPQDRPIVPVESDFIDIEDYRKARIQYEDQIDTWKSNQRQTTEAQERQRQEREVNITAFNERAKRMRDKYPDFDVAVNEPVFTPVMGDEITASEYGPEIGYFLAKNPSEALKISQLTPRGVAKEVGKLEVKFSQAVKRTNSNAPAPLIPIKGDDMPVKDPSKMSDNEWYKWQQEQKLKKLKLGG